MRVVPPLQTRSTRVRSSARACRVTAARRSTGRSARGWSCRRSWLARTRRCSGTSCTRACCGTWPAAQRSCVRNSTSWSNWRTSRKSSYSGSEANCVEVAVRDRVVVRDTKDRTGPVLRFTPAAWREFAGRVKAGVDGTFIWTASHDQRQCSLSTVSFAAAIVVGPEPRSSWSTHSEARTNDLDGKAQRWPPIQHRDAARSQTPDWNARPQDLRPPRARIIVET